MKRGPWREVEAIRLRGEHAAAIALTHLLPTYEFTVTGDRRAHAAASSHRTILRDKYRRKRNTMALREYLWLKPCTMLLLIMCVGCASNDEVEETGALTCEEAGCAMQYRTCTPATHANYATCGECVDEAFERADVCILKTICKSEEFESLASTKTTDRECSTYTVECAEDEYEARPRSDTSDRVCIKVVECNEDEYEAEPRSETSERVCKKISDCDPTEHEVVPPTETSDRVCALRTECESNEYKAREDPGICTPLTLCEAGQHITTEATPTSDRACGACDPGFYCPGGEEEPEYCGVLDRDDDPATPCAKIVELTAGREHTCALDDAGYMLCWGGDPTKLPPPDEARDIHSISAGYEFTCALKNDDNTLTCWGKLTVTSSTELQTIGTGYEHVCWVDITGAVSCDSDASGIVLTPRFNTLGTTVAVGASFGCMIKQSDSQLECWENHHPNPSNIISAPISGPFVEITAGDSYACALRDDGRPVCWGTALPPIPSSARVVTLDSGTDYVCGVDEDNDVVCWDKIEHARSKVPEGLSNVARVSAGEHHTCALHHDGKVTCWGDDDLNQLSGMPEELAP